MTHENTPSPAGPPPDGAKLSELGRVLLGSGGTGGRPVWQPPTPEELAALLPQYEVTTLLGRGGMGAVYMGRQPTLDRAVAIKILSGELEESDHDFAERFKNEARAMAKLNHPGIVSVYDSGQTATGLLYIVMEFVEGTDVQKMITASTRLHTEHAMAIACHVCDALSYAHERGIIHRDIKPANIMVGYDGSVKVADFGLAKMTQSNATGLTQSGMAMGTMHYMAPEALILGTSVDHRADIYAVGVMLYHMLTGKVPQGMFRLPSLQVAGLDPRYDAIIARAIMEDRDERYASTAEMRAALDQILTRPVVKATPEQAAGVPAQAAILPTQARPQRPGGRQPHRPAQTPPGHSQAPAGSAPGRKSLAVWAVGLLLAVLGTCGWWVSRRPEAPKRQPSEVAQVPANTAPAVANTPSVPSTPAPVVPPVSPAPDASGWISLFNGKDLTGWELHPANFPADVQDGAIRIRGSSTIPVSGNMYYRGAGNSMPQWTDFEIICTAMTGNKGNSGIFLHSNPNAVNSNRADGVEVQVWNDFAQNGSTGKSGSLQRVAPTATARFGDGEWFMIKARVEGKRIQTWLKKPAETEWRQAVDWTQPADWVSPRTDGLIKLGSGTISLQNNPPLDGFVLFKDIQLRALGKDATATTTAKLEAMEPPVAASQRVLGRWVRTNMDQPGTPYEMELLAGGRATWWGDGTQSAGTWQFTPTGTLRLAWKSRWDYDLTVSSTGQPLLTGNATGPNRKVVAMRFERAVTTTPEQTVLGTWIRTYSASDDKYAGTRTILELLPQNLARWTIDGEVKNGNWSMPDANTIEGRYASGWPFSMTLSRDSSPMTLTVTSTNPKGIRDPSRYEKTTAQPPEHSTSDSAGWRPLFNGKDLTGWQPYPANLPVSVSNGMMLIRGVDVREKAGLVYFVGEGQFPDSLPKFRNFEFMTTLKTSHQGNSGLKFHVQTLPKASPTPDNALTARGIEVQLWNEGRFAGHDAQFHTGSLYGIAPVSASHFKDEEWFVMRTLVEDRHVQVFLRREAETDWKQVVDWMQPSNWTPPASVPNSGLGEGTFAFSNWVPAEGEVWIKEVKVRSLDTKSSTPAAPPATAGPIASATLWIDAKGRTLQAKFLRMEGSNVVLDIGGKATPVALATLSAASQQIARDLQAAMPPSAERSMPGGASTTSDSGWVPLFPNDSLAGWKGDVGSCSVKDGIMTAGVGDLISKKEYGSFHLKFDLRLSSGGNNGIGIWCADNKGPWPFIGHTGFEIQLLDDNSPSFAKATNPWQLHGALTYFIVPRAKPMGPVGSWNSHEIRMEGTKLTEIINGVTVIEQQLPAGNPIGGSRKHPLDLSRKRGHLVFLGMKGPVDFRNVMIRELP